MTNRDLILESIKKNKPEFQRLPEIPNFPASRQSLVDLFVDAAQKSGTHIITKEFELNQWIKTQYPKNARILSLVTELEGSVYPDPDLQPKDLKHIDLAVIKSPLGVAENGAIWLSEADCRWRILPFISEHLLIFLDRNKIVENMHLAYDSIRIDRTGFGVFIGGPSKTADIEQSLVVGAQGSRSHSIFLM
ncbi:MAG: LUD domain-containing protein [Saprospiraceae bacterium]|nr:LUD domain-containing protein [Saprospiraceae bacterium]